MKDSLGSWDVIRVKLGSIGYCISMYKSCTLLHLYLDRESDIGIQDYTHLSGVRIGAHTLDLLYLCKSKGISGS